MALLRALNSQFLLYGNANRAIIGSDEFNKYFIQVPMKDGKTYQLAANDNSLIFAVNEGSWKSVWQAALKGDLGNIGTYKIVEIDVNDLDNPPNAFILQTSANVDIPGFPSGLGGNRVLVIQLFPGDTRFTAQLALGFGADRLAIRRHYNSTDWTDWKYFAAS